MALRIDSLEITLSKTLSDYADNVSAAVAAEVEKAGKIALKEVKARSPVRKKNGGTYKKGWRLKKGKAVISDNVASVTVYNATRGYLTHLLENGHQSVSGGWVDARPHIEEAQNVAAKALEDGVQQALKEAGV